MAELREALESAIKDAETPASSDAATAPQTAAAEVPQETDLAAASAVDTTIESVQKDDPPEAAEGNAEQSAKEPPQSKEGVEKTGADKTQQETKPHRIDRPPTSWRKEAKGEWANMPLHVRQEIHKRENEINRALQEAAPARQFAEELNRVVSPHMNRIQSRNVTPMQAVESLFKADYTLSSAPMPQRAEYLAGLIKAYGIDIGELDSALARQMGGVQSAPQQSAPDINSIVQRQVHQVLAPLLQQQAAQQQQEVVMTVEQMALDPKYPYFEDVKADMADIIEVSAKKGLYLSLEQAYDKAVRLNDDIFSQANRQSTMQSANQHHQQAQRAKVAASSVSGAPSGGGSFAPQGDGSLRGAIEAAFGGARV